MLLRAFCYCMMAVFFCLPNARAQDTLQTYPLSSFTYRTNGYKALTFFGDFNGRADNSKEGAAERSSSSGSGMSALARYIETKSTERKQSLTSYLASVIPYSFTRESNSGAKTGSFFSQFSLDARNLTRLYKGQRFIEYGAVAGVNGGTERLKQTDTTIKGSNYSILGELQIGAGLGRLEQVTDAQTALFILNDLQAKGLAFNVSPEMVDKFGRFITQMRNGRIFDLRKRTKEQLKLIDQFLRENKLIRSTDAEEISIINDNLYFSFNNDLSQLPSAIHVGYEGGLIPGADFNAIGDYIPFTQAYVFNPGSDLTIFPDYISEFRVHTLQPINEQTLRMSGRKLYARIRGVYNNSKNRQVDAGFTTRGIVAQVGIEKHIPVSLHWQTIYSANLNYFTGRNTSKLQPRFFQDRLYEALNTQINTKIGTFYLNAEWAKRYYPNGRTSIEGRASALLSNGRFNTQQSGGIDQNFWSSTLTADVIGTYFLNSNTVIRGSFSLIGQFGKSGAVPKQSFDKVSGFFGLSFQHVFF